MSRIALIVVLVLSLRCIPSLAGEPGPQPTVGKRELSECMLRRMTAQRTLSYNDAAKACRQILLARKGETSSEAAKGTGGS